MPTSRPDERNRPDLSRATSGKSPAPSLGQKMAQTQASWQPLPLATWPLTNTSSPSAAAYAMPKHTSRHPKPHSTLSNPNDITSSVDDHSHQQPQLQTRTQSESQAHTHSWSQTQTRKSSGKSQEHVSGAMPPLNQANSLSQTNAAQPGQQTLPVEQQHSASLSTDHQSSHMQGLQGLSQQPYPAEPPLQRPQKQTSQHVGSSAHGGATADVSDGGDTDGLQGQTRSQSGVLEQSQSGVLEQQQSQQQQQQQSVRADSSLMEWCSRADELLQHSSLGLPEAAVGASPAQHASVVSLQRGLTALPAYSGDAAVTVNISKFVLGNLQTAAVFGFNCTCFRSPDITICSIDSCKDSSGSFWLELSSVRSHLMTNEFSHNTMHF